MGFFFLNFISEFCEIKFLMTSFFGFRSGIFFQLAFIEQFKIPVQFS